MNNKTCGDCCHLESAKKIGVCQKMKYALCPAELPSCANFEQKIITNGDKIIQKGNKGIAAFACGLLNARSEETFQWVLSFLNAPAESEAKNE